MKTNKIEGRKAGGSLLREMDKGESSYMRSFSDSTLLTWKDTFKQSKRQYVRTVIENLFAGFDDVRHDDVFSAIYIS
jgi:hypothetical protein